MNKIISEVYESALFLDFWECRNSEGYMIGCGATKEEAIIDCTYTEFSLLSDEYTSPNIRRLLPVAELK